MLHEWYFALLFDEVAGFKPVVKALFDFVQPFSDGFGVVDGSETESLVLFLLELFFSHLCQIFIVGVLPMIAGLITAF